MSELFNKLSSVIDRHSFQASEIYNLDETGITTVQKPSKVIARKGMKQVGLLTSGERGQLLTMELAVSASGNSIPPMFVFPRVNFMDHFVREGAYWMHRCCTSIRMDDGHKFSRFHETFYSTCC